MLNMYCPIRKEWVKALPEEIVRQKFIRYMIQQGYPTSAIAVEKELRQMPHLSLSPEIPDRRIDIICFAKDIHPDHSLYPLIVVECKAVPLTKKVINQVMGYNHYLKAYYFVVVNEEHLQLNWYDSAANQYRFSSQLPSYQELIASIIFL